MNTRPASHTDPPTLGVEEEFLLYDPALGAMADRNVEVAQAARCRGLSTQLELTTGQIETATPPVSTSTQLTDELTRSRRTLVDAAHDRGLVLVPAGISPITTDAEITPTARYREIGDRFGMLAGELSMCGCHVHVEMPDRDTAVAVSNHLRPWLPTLLALTANSAIHQATDTGHASWRAVEWSRWPVGGLPPHFRSAKHHDDLVDALVAAGVILDPGMAYWDVRPAVELPTLEIRISDIPATISETVTLACLVRALAVVALRDLDRGITADEIDDNILRAAKWRAAHDGLTGDALTIDGGIVRLIPAADMFHRLLNHVTPVLRDLGELDQISSAVGRTLARGNGASRQRAAFTRGGPHAVIDELRDTALL